MDIYDFCNLCTDDGELVAIYDFTTEEEIFCGSMSDAMLEDWTYYEVLSFDICKHDERGVYLVLNIETESEDE